MPEHVATSTPFLCGFYIKNPRGSLIPLVHIIHVFFLFFLILYICKNKELESLQRHFKMEKYYKPATKHQFLQAHVGLNIVYCGSVSNVSLLLPNATRICHLHVTWTHWKHIGRSKDQIWDRFEAACLLNIPLGNTPVSFYSDIQHTIDKMWKTLRKIRWLKCSKKKKN